MLIHMTIDNFAIAERLDWELASGMTALTGETGAGKSIVLDALGLALGDRADSASVRRGSDRADIHAAFDLARLPAARQWLAERDLLDGDECLLRRVITSEGRSRAFINGRPVTLPDLKLLGELLVEIHGQHAHQSLLKKSHQRQLLDGFAGCEAAAESLRQLAQRRQRVAERLEQSLARRDEHDAWVQLLRYQIEELDELGPDADELTALEAEQRELSNGEQILKSSQQALALCREGEITALSILGQAVRSLQQSASQHRALTEAEQMLNSALIQVDEASQELQRYLDHFELDPERLQAVSDRLSAIYEVARKHRVTPAELPALHRSLGEELAGLVSGDASVESLQAELEQLSSRYLEQADALSQQRRQAATKLEKQVDKQLKQLAMGASRFRVQLTSRPSESFHAQGAEEIEFLISTNPGAEPQPLGKVASGGELSRISLAIQVVTAQTSAVPTLVFDEVDVGIGGATAEIVGQLLRSLGERGQVICVTHQPQVASKAHHHVKVEKHTGRSEARASLAALDAEARVVEVARMVGGVTLTDQSLAYAREMVSLTH